MVREHIDALRAGMRRRGALDALSPTIDRAVTLDKLRRETIQAVEENLEEGDKSPYGVLVAIEVDASVGYARSGSVSLVFREPRRCPP